MQFPPRKDFQRVQFSRTVLISRQLRALHMKSILQEHTGAPGIHPSAFPLPHLGTATPAQLRASPRAGWDRSALICRLTASGADLALPRAAGPCCAQRVPAGRQRGVGCARCWG